MHEPDYLEGIRLFNDGEYWAAHEAWERMWKALPKGSAERRFYQGLIQLAAAFLHRERARTVPERSVRAALRCYRSGMQKLEPLPDELFGLDLAGLRRDAEACFASLEAGAPEAEWPPAPRLAPDGSR
jgi:predicted metal-dependent hydrolase